MTVLIIALAIISPAVSVGYGFGAAPVIEAPANDETTGSAVTAMFTGSTDSFICTIDGIASPCSSGQMFAGLSAGNHTLAVAGIFQSLGSGGGWIGEEAKVKFTVQAPQMFLPGGEAPDEFVNHASRIWHATSVPPAEKLECIFGSPKPGAPTEPTGATAVTTVATDPQACEPVVEQTFPVEGIYTFAMRGTDEAGNRGGWLSRAVVVDRTAPTISFVSAPADGSITDNRNPEFSFISSEPSSYACSIDGAPYSPCNMPHPTGVLAPGTHTLRAFSVDKASNASEPISRTFTVVKELPRSKAEEMGPDSDITSPRVRGVKRSMQLLTIKGRATPGKLGGHITGVDVGILKIRWGKTRGGSWKERCFWMTDTGSFVRGSCRRKQFHRAIGTDEFVFWLKRRLKPGTYQVYSRAHDSNGIHETHFSRRDRTRIPIRPRRR